jgi:hypothetical protein
MIRRLVLSLALLGAAPVAGQYRGSRSTQYLFAANVADARALWVNPAGLGVEFEAAIMGELSADRSRTGEVAFTQLAAGFNSRGVALGYRRDFYNDTLTGHTFRLGAGRALENFAVGAILALHANGDGPTQRGLDVGLRYRLVRSFELAAIVHDIGKPVVHDSVLNLGGTFGLGWMVMRGARLDAEGHITRLTDGGTARAWRGGLSFAPGMFRLPVLLGAALDMDQEFAPVRLTVAITVGGRDRVVGVTSGARPGGTLRLDGVSLAGVASRVP